MTLVVFVCRVEEIFIFYAIYILFLNQLNSNLRQQDLFGFISLLLVVEVSQRIAVHQKALL